MAGMKPGFLKRDGSVTVLSSLLFFLFSSLTGCSLFHVKKESEFIHNAAILVGRISGTGAEKTPIVVIAYSKKGNMREIAHYTFLHEPGSYELLVPKGKYHIFAFGDKNGNMIYDKGEPAGYFGRPDTVSAPAGGVVTNLDFVIWKRERADDDFPFGTVIAQGKAGKMHSTLAGATADLDDEIFSDEYGDRGYWAGVDFFRELGGNIYFLEKYDPAKIPVLFVHGAKGTPRNWRYFAAHIDRTRYQPWFFYYPSGAPLKTMGNLLSKKLWDLQLRYHFKRLHICAHSMGGLLVRSFLMDHGRYHPYIRLFVSISTPWGGEKLAEIGVRHSPGVIPSWEDMLPEGEFIASLFRDKLPPRIAYYLFFGFKGRYNPFLPNGDGVVAMASQLDLRAQSEARATYGFNADHVGILSSPDVLKQFNSILSSTDRDLSGNAMRQGGKLRVLFSFDAPDNDPRPQVALLLHPASERGEKKILFLNPRDSGNEFGPFPAGKYIARITAAAFRAEPEQIPVEIVAGKVPSVGFAFKPQGILCGYIGADPKPTYTAGAFPEENASVKSVTLAGGGIRRALLPSKGDSSDALDFFSSGRDYCIKGEFCFFGLPEGEYDLTITADGYKPHNVKQSVVPGRFGNAQPILLRRETLPR
jgi:pimeloyl-ACP methyl ester carboxylesterase